MTYQETQEAIAKLKPLMDSSLPTVDQAVEMTVDLQFDSLPGADKDWVYINRNYYLCIATTASFSPSKQGNKMAVRTNAAGTKIYCLSDKLIERLLKFYKV